MNRARSLHLGASGSLLLVFVSWTAATSRAADTSQTGCASCHEQAAKLSKSAHAALACDTCHQQHEKYPHPAGVPKPACTGCHQSTAGDYERGVHGQAVKKGNTGAPDCSVCHGGAHELIPPKAAEFRAKVPETCGMCHSQVVEQYQSSVHGQALAKGIPQAPLCTDCHGEHSIIPHRNAASPVNTTHIRATCGSCHGDVRLSRKFGLPADRIVSFDASYHGLAAKAGSQTVANCASCHGVHNILPSSDPKSTIHARNLPATCGHCHAGAGTRFAISQVHVQEGRTEPVAVGWARRFYLVVIPLTLGLMLLHNGGDWIRKLIGLRTGKKIVPEHRGPLAIRMLPFERVQHALLLVSFVTLVWTGFALKYPDEWWARPLLAWEGKTALRSLVHRVAAAVMVAVAVTHVLSLVASRRLRNHWRSLLPQAADAREAVGNMAYNLGLRANPGRSAHSYIEKAEYWAVAWGTVVMAVTGGMLWADNLMLKLLPKTWLDAATAVHFYEAILATLSIVVWHLYSAIFDPDVYPLDTAFLTGVSVKEHEILEETTKAAEAATR